MKRILFLMAAFAYIQMGMACTNFLVGKGASTDGSVFITYNADSYGMYGRLIKLGYQTGGMDTIFRDIANAYDQETSEALSHAISIIEPTLVIILSIITGIILLSVMLPLLGIMGSL